MVSVQFPADSIASEESNRLELYWQPTFWVSPSLRGGSLEIVFPSVDTAAFSSGTHPVPVPAGWTTDSFEAYTIYLYSIYTVFIYKYIPAHSGRNAATNKMASENLEMNGDGDRNGGVEVSEEKRCPRLRADCH